MNRLLIAIILGLLPLLSFILQHYFSKKEGRLREFKNHFQCYYLDWLFIPFGIIWIYIVNISFNTFLILLGISIILNSITHIYWKFAVIRNNESCHMFGKKIGKIGLSGIVHFFFSTIISALFLGFLFFSVKSSLTYLAGIIIVLFFLGGFISSKKIHGKIILSDLILIVLGIFVVLIKFLLLN